MAQTGAGAAALLPSVFKCISLLGAQPLSVLLVWHPSVETWILKRGH